MQLNSNPSICKTQKINLSCLNPWEVYSVHSGLYKHIKNTHENDGARTHGCQFCTKAFTSAKRLQDHIQDSLSYGLLTRGQGPTFQLISSYLILNTLAFRLHIQSELQVAFVQ